MKKTISTLLSLSFILFLSYGCDTGNIVTETVRVSNASAAKLYYPRDISAPTGATTMSAGYTQTLNDVEWLSIKLAEAGYVVLGMTPDNNWGMVSGWRDMHKSGIAKLQEFSTSHSVLSGLIDTNKLQTCGHSKGGGGSLWASSQLQGALRTTVGMAPYQEQFYDSTLSSITSATFVQAGASDTLATNTMTRGEYNALPNNISKMYVEYTGFGHLAWTTGAGSTQQAVISEDIIAWMKYYMDGDTSYAATLSDTSGTSRHEWVDNSGY